MHFSSITLIFLLTSLCSAAAAAAVALHPESEFKFENSIINAKLNDLDARGVLSRTRNFQLAIIESWTGRKNPDSSCTWDPVHWNIHRYKKLPDPNVRTLCSVNDSNNKRHYSGRIFMGSVSSKSLFTCGETYAKAGKDGYSGTSNICLAIAQGGLQANLRIWETRQPVWNTKCFGVPNSPVIYECGSGNACQRILLLYTCDKTEFEDKGIHVVPT